MPPADKTVRYGAWLAALSLLLTPLALLAFILGAIAAGKNRVGAGVLIMAASVASVILAVVVWDAVLTGNRFALGKSGTVAQYVIAGIVGLLLIFSITGGRREKPPRNDERRARLR